MATLRDDSSAEKPNPDEALRTAIKAAFDAADLVRVRALVDVLSAGRSAPVVDIATRRKGNP